MATTTEDRLDATFAALANTTRRAMLARLAHGEATVNELAEPFDLSLPAISKHLKVLERAGLVVRGQHAQYRPRTLDPGPSRRSRRGPSSTGRSGRPAWTGWTPTCSSSDETTRTRNHHGHDEDHPTG